MAPKRRTPSIPSSSPISVGNCEVIVHAKNFTSESNCDGVEISLSKTSKIRISVVKKRDEHDDVGDQGRERSANCYFVLANPKDSTGQIKSLLQEVLTLYMKELPAMNFAANTGKESKFLQRCVTNGKYCTLILKSKDDVQPGEVIAAITYQIIPADTRYAEVPLAAVKSIFQRKGTGRLLYLELKKRLLSVGVQTLFCWGDEESEGFWVKQGFTVIGEVAKNGRARRLPLKADIRKALSFPGGSTLMSHLLEDRSSELVELPNLCLPTKLLQLEYKNQELMHIEKSHEPSNENNQIAEIGCSESEKLPVNGCQDVNLLPLATKCSEGEDNCSCSMHRTKKRMWETSCTSLKSKKVRGASSNDCQLDSHSPNWTSDGRIADGLDRSCCLTFGNKFLPDALLENSGSNNMHDKDELRAGDITNEDYGSPEIPRTAKYNRIMLMNIADDDKKSRVTKIIEDLGGVIATDGSLSTHVVTGKVFQTRNFCTALCSGAWVISSGWLKESFKKGIFVDETPFILNDVDYRTKYRTELKNAVLRAKASPGALLKGFDIWLTTRVQPPTNTLSAIVMSVGGNVSQFKEALSAIVMSAGGNVIWSKNEINDVSKTIFVACEEDMEEALSAVKLGIWTFSSEWFMNCIMRQELDLEAPQFAESL